MWVSRSAKVPGPDFQYYASVKNHDPEVTDCADSWLWKHLNSADIILKT